MALIKCPECSAKMCIRDSYTTEGLSVILRRHTHQGLEHYSESLVFDAVAEVRKKYDFSGFCRNFHSTNKPWVFSLFRKRIRLDFFA